MKLSELVSALQELVKDHGDKDVRFAAMSGEWVITKVKVAEAKEAGMATGSMFAQYPDEPARVVLTGTSLG